MAGEYFWISGPDGNNNTAVINVGSPALFILDALGGMDIFNFNWTINPANFTLTKNSDGSVAMSGASDGHNLNVKLVNFETIKFVDTTHQTTDLSIADIEAGTSGDDAITGTVFKDTINGGSGNDRIVGGSSKDTLLGGAGIDKLNGGSGKDVLTGGSDVDTFVFNAKLNANTNVDTIKDFAVGDVRDIFQLDDDIFKGIGTGTANGTVMEPDKFVFGTAAQDANDRIIYNIATGALSYDADGNGAGAAVQFAIVGISSHPMLGASDFFVIP